MDKKLQEQLYEKYPLTFLDKDKSKKESGMYYGIAVKDGWYNIVEELCSKLEPMIQDFMNRHPNVLAPRACQVKEKFGCLEFYVDNAKPSDIGEPLSDKIRELTLRARSKSLRACEFCGAKGSKHSHDGYVKTLCTKHKQEREVR